MLSDALRHYIRDRGISPAALAREIGQHRSTVTRWLSGERGLSEETINKIAAYLHLIPVPSEAIQALLSMQTQMEQLKSLHVRRVEITDRLVESIRLLAEENARLREQLLVASPATSEFGASLNELEAQFRVIGEIAHRGKDSQASTRSGRGPKTSDPPQTPEHGEWVETFDPAPLTEGELEDLVRVTRSAVVPDAIPSGPSSKQKGKKAGRK